MKDVETRNIFSNKDFDSRKTLYFLHSHDFRLFDPNLLFCVSHVILSVCMCVAHYH